MLVETAALGVAGERWSDADDIHPEFVNWPESVAVEVALFPAPGSVPPLQAAADPKAFELDMVRDE